MAKNDKEKDSSPNISANLRKLMSLANISEHELSRRTGIKQPIINRLLSGENNNPKLLTLKPLAEYFLVSISQLIGEQEMNAIWQGFTSNSHKGWSEIPIINWKNIAQPSKETLLKTIKTESSTHPEIFAYYIEDNSMEPLFSKKSFAVIDPNLKATNGDYILVKDSNNTFFLRSFLLRSGIEYINPINNSYGVIRKILFNEKIVGVAIRSVSL